MAKETTTGGVGKTEKPAVKTGKTPETTRVTSDTVRRLERAGSWESAKIAREYVKP